MAGVDAAVVEDSLAMISHGHPNTMPAAMEMMLMHAQAVHRKASNFFVLGCMPYQIYHTPEIALRNATRFMQEAGSDAVKPQGGKSQSHSLKTLVDASIPIAKPKLTKRFAKLTKGAVDGISEYVKEVGGISR